MYIVNKKALLLILVALLIVISSLIFYYLISDLSDKTDNMDNTEQPAIKYTAEQPDTQESIQQKLESNNQEVLEREQVQEDKTLIILGTDERSTEISRSDIIMVIRIDPAAYRMVIVSVPRDTKVNIPGHKHDKINHAYAFGGAELSVKTIEGLFDVKVDNYLKFGFEDFKEIVDNFNGVEVTAVKDFKEYDTVRVHKGEQLLNGEDALFYVRYRDDSEGDYGRIKRQQEVVRSLTDRILHFDKEKLTPIITRLYSEVIETDLDIAEINNYLEYINSDRNIDIYVSTFKTHSIKTNGIWYEEFDEKDLAEAIELLKGDKNGTGISGD